MSDPAPNTPPPGNAPPAAPSGPTGPTGGAGLTGPTGGVGDIGAPTPPPANNGSLFTPPPAEGNAPPPGSPPPPAAPDQAAIDAFVTAIPSKELNFDEAAVKALAPGFLKHGLKPEQAKELIASYCAYQQAQQQAAAEAERQAVEQIVAKTKAELGADLPTFVNDASRGGAAFFGPELWGQLVNATAFVNDVRVIKALAQYGRSVKTDDGAGTGGGHGQDNRPFADRWIASSNGQ